MKSYAIANLDAPPRGEFFDRVALLVRERIDFIQLRAPALDDAVLLRTARECRSVIAPPTRFLVNRRADVALAVGADGVHLPARGIPVSAVRALGEKLFVGRSCHTVAECAAAATEGADYVVFGPLFDPRSKLGNPPVPRSEIAAAARCGVPLFALGGISLENLAELAGLPIGGIAAITLFMHDEPVMQIMEAVRAL